MEFEREAQRLSGDAGGPGAIVLRLRVSHSGAFAQVSIVDSSSDSFTHVANSGRAPPTVKPLTYIFASPRLVQREDGWKYVGGDTFLYAVPANWSYSELVFFMAEKCNRAVSLKYKFHGDQLDPDALISLHDDEDLQVSVMTHEMNNPGLLLPLCSPCLSLPHSPAMIINKLTPSFLRSLQMLRQVYQEALRASNTPAKMFSLHLFLFAASEEVYTPEDLSAEAHYREHLPPGSDISTSDLPAAMSAFLADGAAAAASDFVPSELDLEELEGMATPSTNTETELAWEAGFKAGQEAAMIANEEWMEFLQKRMKVVARAASKIFLDGQEECAIAEDDDEGYLTEIGDGNAAWEDTGERSPLPSLRAPGVGAGVVLSDEDGQGTVRMGSPSRLASGELEPSAVGAEFEDFHESKYAMSNDTRRRLSGRHRIAPLSPTQPLGLARSLSAETVGPKQSFQGGLAIRNGSASGADRGVAGGDGGNVALDTLGSSVLSPNTRLPTHISVFGDDVEEALAAAVMRELMPPPAAAANLPSHISEFGGSEDADVDPLVAVVAAALPDGDMPRGNQTPPPDPAMIPTNFGLLAGATGEGAVPRAPPSLQRSDNIQAMLAKVHHVDMSTLTVEFQVGSGSFGEVSLCVCPTYGSVAVKWIKHARKVDQWASFWREAELMSRLNHPNVLRFYGLVTEGEFVVGIMTEYADSGNLSTFMRRSLGGDGMAYLPLRQRAQLALNAVNGLAYLHSQKVVHFDVKPDNLLVTGDWSTPGGPVIKVADFGLSVVKANTFCSNMSDFRGTLPYMAPEMLKDLQHVSEAADVWSLGVVFWEMLTLEVPFATEPPAQLLAKLVAGARLPIPEWCEPEWRVLIECCWVEEQELRPTCRQLAVQLQHILDRAPL